MEIRIRIYLFSCSVTCLRKKKKIVENEMQRSAAC